MTKYKVVLVPVTFDDHIDSSSIDFAQTGLQVPSTLRLHRLMTATTRFIVRELGDLSAAWQCEIDDKLRELFKL